MLDKKGDGSGSYGMDREPAGIDVPAGDDFPVTDAMPDKEVAVGDLPFLGLFSLHAFFSTKNPPVITVDSL